MLPDISISSMAMLTFLYNFEAFMCLEIWIPDGDNKGIYEIKTTALKQPEYDSVGACYVTSAAATDGSRTLAPEYIHTMTHCGGCQNFNVTLSLLKILYALIANEWSYSVDCVNSWKLSTLAIPCETRLW